MNLSARSTKSFTLIVVFFLFFIACSQCMASDQILGKWQDNGDGSTIEFLSDGTALLDNMHGRIKSMSGKWIRLDDGRVKMDFSMLGTTSTILWRVKVKGDTLECIDQKGGLTIFKRQSESMLPKAQAGDKSATLPTDLVNFIHAYYTKLPAFPTRLWADCKRYTCKDLEINCGKSIPINRGEKLNGVTARYIVVYSFITNMDGRNIEVVEQNSFTQKGNTWSYGMPSRSMETSESQCSQLSY